MKTWNKEQVATKLREISGKGFISIPDGMYRNDDGIVGQILEREFAVEENNLHIADLGTYELKGMRYKKGKSSTLTLFHQTSTAGMTPLQLFERFSYLRASQRDGSLKRKLFTTIYGNKENSLGFILEHTMSICTITMNTWRGGICHQEYKKSSKYSSPLQKPKVKETRQMSSSII